LGNSLFIIDKLLRKYGKGGLDTGGDGGFVQTWRTEGWGNRTYDGTGLQHGKPGDEGVEGEVEKDKKLQGLGGEDTEEVVKNKDLLQRFQRFNNLSMTLQASLGVTIWI